MLRWLRRGQTAQERREVWPAGEQVRISLYLNSSCSTFLCLRSPLISAHVFKGLFQSHWGEVGRVLNDPESDSPYEYQKLEGEFLKKRTIIAAQHSGEKGNWSYAKVSPGLFFFFSKYHIFALSSYHRALSLQIIFTRPKSDHCLALSVTPPVCALVEFCLK